VIAAGAALTGAWIAARSARNRQAEQLKHDLEKLRIQLAHDRGLHSTRLDHDINQQTAQLRHARVLHDLDDRRASLDEALELLLHYRERAARGLRKIAGTAPRLPYEDVESLPVLDSYTREDAVKFRRMEARLALRFGDDSLLVERFDKAQDEMKRAVRLIQHESDGAGAEKARKDGRRAVKAFTDAAIRELGDEPRNDETGGTPPPAGT
jgi:CRISPR/Cas system CSM-associated protein Csm2 small subunit